MEKYRNLVDKLKGGNKMTYENIIYKLENNIATIIFNRPESANALNNRILEEFTDVLNRISINEKVRVLILTGSGKKSFVAGADIKEIAKLNPIKAKIFCEKAHYIVSKLEKINIPVIAAVNGYALGGGSEIAIACDFIYASDNACFGLPEINLGIIPGFGGTQRLPRLIGKNMAKELIFTGKIITAKEAKEIGLVNKVYESSKLMLKVYETAKLLAHKGRVSIRAAKQSINTGLNIDLSSGCKYEIDAFSLCIASEDSKEGTNAFLEKRKTNFTGEL